MLSTTIETDTAEVALCRCSQPPCVVAVLVDEALWRWRGDRWAHLISDQSICELHQFAARLGLRLMAFQGDHYDIQAKLREKALKLGALPVNGRDVVRILRESGLRLPASKRPGKWSVIATWGRGTCAPEFYDRVALVLLETLDTCVDADWNAATVTLYRRIDEWALVVEDGDPLLTGSILDTVKCRSTPGGTVELISGGIAQ